MIAGHWRPIVLAFLVSGLVVFPALAEKSNSGAILPGGNSKEPINIDAAKLDYFDKEQKLVYTGGVIATQGESKLKSSTLVIFLTPKEFGGNGSSLLIEPSPADGSGGSCHADFKGSNRHGGQRNL